MGKGWWVGPGAVAGPLRGYVSYHSPEMYEKNGGINLTGFFICDLEWVYPYKQALQCFWVAPLESGSGVGTLSVVFPLL